MVDVTTQTETLPSRRGRRWKLAAAGMALAAALLVPLGIYLAGAPQSVEAAPAAAAGADANPRSGYWRAVRDGVSGYSAVTGPESHVLIQGTGESYQQLRNGPCGGVRPNGGCEVRPDMTCVWVLAWEGNKRLSGDRPIQTVQPPVDHRLIGHSAWLREVRLKTAAPAAEQT